MRSSKLWHGLCSVWSCVEHHRSGWAELTRALGRAEAVDLWETVGLTIVGTLLTWNDKGKGL